MYFLPDRGKHTKDAGKPAPQENNAKRAAGKCGGALKGTSS